MASVRRRPKRWLRPSLGSAANPLRQAALRRRLTVKAKVILAIAEAYQGEAEAAKGRSRLSLRKLTKSPPTSFARRVREGMPADFPFGG